MAGTVGATDKDLRHLHQPDVTDCRMVSPSPVLVDAVSAAPMAGICWVPANDCVVRPSCSNHQRQAIQIGAATSKLNTSITEMSVSMERMSTSRQRNSSGDSAIQICITRHYSSTKSR